MKITMEEKKVMLAVLRHPLLHYKACFEDMSGRPQGLNCICPVKHLIEKVNNAEIKEAK